MLYLSPMTRRKNIFSFIVVLGLSVVGIVFLMKGPETPESYESLLLLPQTPEEAVFSVDEEDIVLHEGVSENGSISISEKVSPMYGDMTGDGVEDVVVLLEKIENDAIRYFVALAVKDEYGYTGMEAALLERGEIASFTIEDEVLEVNYPQGDSQGESESDYYTLQGIRLQNVTPTNSRMLLRGTITLMDGVYMYTPCGSPESFMVDSDSRAYAALTVVYAQRSAGNNTIQYIVADGMIVSDTAEDEDVQQKEVQLESILTAPKNGECAKSAGTPTPIPLTEAPTEVVEETEETEELQ
jgi:hypothetical protein